MSTVASCRSWADEGLTLLLLVTEGAEPSDLGKFAFMATEEFDTRQGGRR